MYQPEIAALNDNMMSLLLSVLPLLLVPICSRDLYDWLIRHPAPFTRHHRVACHLVHHYGCTAFIAEKRLLRGPRDTASSAWSRMQLLVYEMNLLHQ